jgi:hypothetical protein
MVRYIDESLYEEILVKKKKIEGSPEYYDKRKTLVIQDLRSIGDVYSFWIENPELRKSLLTENKQPKTLRKLAMHGIQNVHNSWYFLSERGKYGGFIKELNAEVLKKTNGLVQGERFNDFRSKDVSLNIKEYTPPSYEKVSKKINEAISKVKEIYQVNPIEAAVTAHLEIAAIQPFMEGNKRTARLIQDRILYDEGLPPAIISAGEGKFYRNLLCKVLPAYDEGDVEGQKEFYNYCASKVNNGLDDILGDLVLEPAKINL